jgi:hypothetical protein
LESRATATLHEYAQLQVVVALLIDQLLDLVGRTFGEDQGCWHFGNCVHSGNLR